MILYLQKSKVKKFIKLKISLKQWKVPFPYLNTICNNLIIVQVDTCRTLYWAVILLKYSGSSFICFPVRSSQKVISLLFSNNPGWWWMYIYNYVKDHFLAAFHLPKSSVVLLYSISRTHSSSPLPLPKSSVVLLSRTHSSSPSLLT